MATFGQTFGLVTPYEDYAGFFLKCFKQGTTEPISMATDSTGGTLLAKAEVSSGGDVPIGFFKTAGNVIFNPHLAEAYDAFLFPTEDEADANNTTNAIQLADDLTPANVEAEDIVRSITNINFDNVADMVTNGVDLVLGDFTSLEEHTAGNESGVLFGEVVNAGTGTADNGSFIDLPNTTPALQWKQNFPTIISVKMFGGVGDASDDEAAIIIAAIDYLSDGQTLDFGGGSYKIFTGVTGVPSGNGDALPLDEVPRLFDKSNITLRNGTIFAADPAVADSRVLYPSTLTIDGCTDISLEKLSLSSKGQDFGDTGASVSLSREERRAFAAQNGGHACVIIRSEGVDATSCNFRLCGSVGAYYVISSNNVTANNCFSNPGSLGYASYAVDSWAGDTSVSGFIAHNTVLSGCSTNKEDFTFGSKGCVTIEDVDVHVEINGGYYADAFANGTSRDIGYAFGAAGGSTLIVDGAVVQSCTAIGYTALIPSTTTTMLINNVRAAGLTKTVHQCKEETTNGIHSVRYSNCTCNVAGGGTWAGDGNLTREATSYVAMPNSVHTIEINFSHCDFTAARYAFINPINLFGKLEFSDCEINTNGFLASTNNIGGGSADFGKLRGIIFSNCGIEDTSSETGAYFILGSNTDVFSYIDMSTSTVRLNSVRDMESSTIPTPLTFSELFNMPRPGANREGITATKSLKSEDARIQTITNTAGAERGIRLTQTDKYKFYEFLITLDAASSGNLRIEDDTGGTTYLTLTPGQSAKTWNDGVDDFVRLL